MRLFHNFTVLMEDLKQFLSLPLALHSNHQDVKHCGKNDSSAQSIYKENAKLVYL